MDINNPLVTVILPVFNRRHLINRAIESVRRQICTDWELLIVDDGSTDGLEGDILPLIASSENFRYMKHANRKLWASRNIGIQAALGKYITFLDSDDEYAPEHLQLRINYFAEHKEVDVVHGGVELIGPEETFYVQDAFNPGKMIHISECCVGATFFGKKSVFIKSGGFRQTDYSSESEYLPRLLAIATVQKVNFSTYKYYTGLEDSICTLRKNETEINET